MRRFELDRRRRFCLPRSYAQPQRSAGRHSRAFRFRCAQSGVGAAFRAGARRCRKCSDEKLLSLGVYPETKLVRARALADEAKQQLRNGVDPGDVRKARKNRGGRQQLSGSGPGVVCQAEASLVRRRSLLGQQLPITRALFLMRRCFPRERSTSSIFQIIGSNFHSISYCVHRTVEWEWRFEIRNFWRKSVCAQTPISTRHGCLPSTRSSMAARIFQETERRFERILQSRASAYSNQSAFHRRQSLPSLQFIDSIFLLIRFAQAVTAIFERSVFFCSLSFMESELRRYGGNHFSCDGHRRLRGPADVPR